MSRSLDHMPDDLVQPEDAARHVGEILAGAATWQRYRPRMREDTGPEADPSEISRQTEALLDLLAEREINCVLVGAVAMLQYVPGRNTKDIDFIMPKSELRRCPEIVVFHEDETFCQASFGCVNVDFLYSRHRLFQEVAVNYCTVRHISGHLIKCATPTGLVILKLFAIPSLLYQFREGKIRQYESDIEGMIETCEVPDDEVLALLQKHLKPGELLAVKTVLTDLRARIATRKGWMEEFRKDLPQG